MSNLDYLSNAHLVRQSSVERIKARMAEESELKFDLAIADIDPNPYQPRVDFGAVEDMARSLREDGQHYPILVRRRGSRYEVADGETRLRASRYNLEFHPKHPGTKTTIGAVIRDYDDEQMGLVAFHTAYQRKDLNPIEEARGLKRLHDELGLDYPRLAEKLGKKEHYLWGRVRLLGLPERLQALVASGELSPSRAVNLATYEGPPATLDALVDRVLADDLSVHKIRELVKQESTAAPAPAEPVSAEPAQAAKASAESPQLPTAKPVPTSQADVLWHELRQGWNGLTAAQQADLVAYMRTLRAAKRAAGSKAPSKQPPAR